VTDVNVACWRTKMAVVPDWRTTIVMSFTGMGFDDPQDPAL
jgi:hypothetical protein